MQSVYVVMYGKELCGVYTDFETAALQIVEKVLPNTSFSQSEREKVYSELKESFFKSGWRYASIRGFYFIYRELLRERIQKC